jgi:hypothetical protein
MLIEFGAPMKSGQMNVSIKHKLTQKHTNYTNNSILYTLHIRDNTTLTPKNYKITRIHPSHRIGCVNKSFGRVDDTHKKSGI